jgi:UDP-N-acetylmuramate dehydrogenase
VVLDDSPAPPGQARLDEQIDEMCEWRQKGLRSTSPAAQRVQNPSGRLGGRPKAAPQDSWWRRRTSRVIVSGGPVSPMHANYFVNIGGASAADVRALIEHAQRTVEERFGVRLEPEVKLIGSRGEYLNREKGEK